MQLNKLISLSIIAISIVTIYFILSSKEDKMISNIDSEQAISVSTTTQKKIQTPSESLNESITNKEEQHRQHQLVKETPEPIKNEAQTPIFEKIGDSTYRISDRSDLSKVAELAAIEFAETNKDQDFFWSDFNKAIGGEPVSVKNECTNSYYELVPLYIQNEYAGLVQADYLDKNTIKIITVSPSSFFHTENLSAFKDKFLPFDKEQAVSTLEKKLNIDNRYISYNDLFFPCAEKMPLAPSIYPFHSFSIDGKRYLVNSTDGKIITEQSMEKYKFDLKRFFKQLSLKKIQ